MPACIVELGFMNSPTDNQLFDANVENYAKAIGDAVLKHMRLMEKTEQMLQNPSRMSRARKNR